MPSFAPLIGNNATVLILGSMPSQISLRELQYYANPNNTFWWIVSRIWKFSETISYEKRVIKLTISGVAVWDVLADCVRHGSLDSRIEKDSEIANNLNEFLLQNPSICLIAFNGRAANQIFNRHCSDVSINFPKLRFVLLPSSSPAHAAVSKEQKLTIWTNKLTKSNEWQMQPINL